MAWLQGRMTGSLRHTRDRTGEGGRPGSGLGRVLGSIGRRRGRRIGGGAAVKLLLGANGAAQQEDGVAARGLGGWRFRRALDQATDLAVVGVAVAKFGGDFVGNSRITIALFLVLQAAQ